MTDTFRLKNISKAFVFAGGTKSVIPMLASDKGYGLVDSHCRSMFPGVYGGVISENILSEGQTEELEDYILNMKATDVAIVGNPLSTQHFFSDKFKKKEMFTHMLKLESSFGSILSRFSPKARRRGKSGIKKGVEIQQAATWQDYKEYYKTYQASRVRWGTTITTSYDIRLFENIFKQSRNTDSIRLWLAKFNKKVIGGVLVFYWNQHAVEWHASFLRDYANFSPNNTLRSEIIKDACEKKYKYYDFNPSGGLEGVIKFKESFGAEKVFFNYFKWDNKKLLYRLLKKLS